MVGREGADGLAGGNGCAAGCARDDDRLADVRERIFRAERRGGPAEGADAGADIIVDAQLFQRVKLLPHSAIDARVAGMETDSGLALGLGLTDDGNDLLQRHFRAVVDLTARLRSVQQRWIDERPGIDDDVRLAEQPRAAHGDEVRCAAPGTDKMYHSYPSIMVPSSSCARLVRHRRPYSLENTIAPAAISPHLCAR